MEHALTLDNSLASSLIAAAKGSGSFGGPGTNTLQLIMLIAAIGGLTLILLSTRRKMRARAAEGRSTVRERYAALDQAGRTARDGEQVVVELDRISREIHARVDTKFAKLEAVIRDADARIGELNRLLRASRAGSTCDVTLPDEDPHRPAEEAPATNAAEPHDAIYRLADEGLPALTIAERTGRPTGEVELILALRRTREAALPPVSRA